MTMNELELHSMVWINTIRMMLESFLLCFEENTGGSFITLDLAKISWI